MPLCSNLSATSTLMRGSCPTGYHQDHKDHEGHKGLVILVTFVDNPWLVSYEMHQQPVAQLGLEPRGLGGHDAPFVRNGDQIVDGHGVHREGDRGLPAVDGVLERGRAARAADEIDPRVGPHVSDLQEWPE